MSTHFAELLEQLHRRCLGMGEATQGAVQTACEAVLNRSVAGAQGVMAQEAAVDSEEVEIEKQAINLLAAHQPAAGDLRTLFAIVKINADLERIADCAVNIAEQVAAVAASGGDVPRDLRVMIEATRKQVDDTLRCLAHKNTELAEEICRADDVIDALYHQLVQELQAGMVAHPASVPGNLAMIFVARNLERIGDHCTNIAEDVLYRLRGKIVRHTHDPR